MAKYPLALHTQTGPLGRSIGSVRGRPWPGLLRLQILKQPSGLATMHLVVNCPLLCVLTIQSRQFFMSHTTVVCRRSQVTKCALNECQTHHTRRLALDSLTTSTIRRAGPNLTFTHIRHIRTHCFDSLFGRHLARYVSCLITNCLQQYCLAPDPLP